MYPMCSPRTSARKAFGSWVVRLAHERDLHCEAIAAVADRASYTSEGGGVARLSCDVVARRLPLAPQLKLDPVLRDRRTQCRRIVGLWPSLPWEAHRANVRSDRRAFLLEPASLGGHRARDTLGAGAEA